MNGVDRGRATSPVRPAGTGVTPFHQVAVPAQDGIRLDEQPQPAQHLTWQRCQQRGEESPIPGREPHPGIDSELPFKHGDLMAQGEYLNVLVTIGHE
ncbi:hypothetical protein [Nonomuraea sp. NPDC005650]|uniref:hypothetical protein n=1 Tax=Nonomuraea sp. NPDC005650 TaxID=3157045 RepID=UPI0033AC854C